MQLGASEVQLLTVLSELLRTVIVPPDPLNCGVRHERGMPGFCPTPEYNQSFYFAPQLKPTRIGLFGEFPWLASLHVASSNASGAPPSACGGVLVHPQVVLASAACHQEALKNQFELTVRLAEYRVNSDVDFDRPPADLAIRRALYHPDFRQEGPAVQSDVVLLFLERPAPLANDVGLICLPWWSDTVEGLADEWESSECVLHGWSDPRKDAIDAVLYERVDFLSRGACQARLRELHRLGPFQQIHESFACATAEQRKCWADVGSVLACRHRLDKSRWMLAGMLPWARLHEKCDQVSTYTNIGVFAPWIKATITAELSTQP